MQEIDTRFRKDVERFANAEFKDWKHTPRNNLAGIILTDQFTRSDHRRYRAADGFALDVCIEAPRSSLIWTPLRSNTHCISSYVRAMRFRERHFE